MIIPSGFAHVQHRFTTSALGRVAAVTYGVQLIATDFGQNLAEDLYDLWQLHIMPNLSTQLSQKSVLLKFGPNETGPAFEFTGTGVGGNTEAGMAPNTAYLAKKRTALGGRENRGRMYIPGVIEAAVNESGQVVGDTKANIEADLTAFLAALDTAGLPMFILHNSTSVPTEVTSLLLDPVVATQRRRLR